MSTTSAASLTDPPDQEPVILQETVPDSDSPNLNRSPPAMKSNDREYVPLQETYLEAGRLTQQSSSFNNILNQLTPRALKTISNITT